MWNWLEKGFSRTHGDGYLCLIYLDEDRLGDARGRGARLNARHLEFNDGLLSGGQFVEAEALEPAHSTALVRVRNGRASVTDGPFAETKEQVAGFYFIEARDFNEAIRLAARIPAASLGAVEVRPCRDLVVDGVARKASRKAR
jgi:hypothetical protein